MLDFLKFDEFTKFRANYLLAFVVVMLADGMQGTHLYALYSEYNFNVANLYATGFLAGAISSPFMGPLVDKFGRKKSAIVYCVLEIIINIMEQYKCLIGLLASRIIGGITTNLLFTVFESWVITQHRKKGFAEEKFEIILRDSVIASNVSAIASGFIAHSLASKFGAIGPFQGAVGCTFMALVLVSLCWEENFGVAIPGQKNLSEIMRDGIKIVVSDTRILRIGLIQGLTEGTLQTFIFLWSPTLLNITFKSNFNPGKIGLLFMEENGTPAYGLIFGSFMSFGTLGGIIQPYINNVLFEYIERKMSQSDISRITKTAGESDDEKSCGSNLVETENFSNLSKDDDILCLSSDEIRAICANVQAAICFILCSALLATAVFLEGEHAFILSILAFFCYEFLLGMYLPCEGILRSIYLPEDEVCTLMTMLRVVVNILVAVGVISSNFMELKSAFLICATSLLLASILQFSLVKNKQWIWVSDKSSIEEELGASRKYLFSWSKTKSSSTSPIDGDEILIKLKEE